jgi:uncharacterized membrane protein YeaQ/YmgE (transglycosylase-associated protein family)
MEPVSHGAISSLVIGGISSASASRIIDGRGFGFVVDVVAGIVGAFIGGGLCGHWVLI